MEPKRPDVPEIEEADDDPLLGILGLVDDPEGPDDQAENHDHYLYGAPKKRP